MAANGVVGRLMIFGAVLSALAVAAVLAGCGVRSGASAKNEADPAGSERRQQLLPHGRDSGATGSEFQAAGAVWRVREATPRRVGHPDSGWVLGEVKPFRATMDSAGALLADPAEWPAPEAAELVLQIEGQTRGDWSARCVKPNGEMELSTEVRLLDWEGESGSLVLPLSGIFGKRGELRDPSTLCHLLVRFTSSEFRFSLRVLGQMPVLQPVSHQDFAWEPGATIRREVWTNPTARFLELELNPEWDLRVDAIVQQQDVFVFGKERKQVATATLRSQETRFAIEGRVKQGASWGSWTRLPLKVDWTPGQTHEVEYRMVLLDSAAICGTSEQVLQRFPLNVGVLVRHHLLHSRHWSGKLIWQASVSERLNFSQPSQYLQPFAIPERLDSKIFPEGVGQHSCQGWVR